MNPGQKTKSGGHCDVSACACSRMASSAEAISPRSVSRALLRPCQSSAKVRAKEAQSSGRLKVYRLLYGSFSRSNGAEVAQKKHNVLSKFQSPAKVFPVASRISAPPRFRHSCATCSRQRITWPGGSSGSCGQTDPPAVRRSDPAGPCCTKGSGCGDVFDRAAGQAMEFAQFLGRGGGRTPVQAGGSSSSSRSSGREMLGNPADHPMLLHGKQPARIDALLQQPPHGLPVETTGVRGCKATSGSGTARCSCPALRSSPTETQCSPPISIPEMAKPSCTANMARPAACLPPYSWKSMQLFWLSISTRNSVS